MIVASFFDGDDDDDTMWAQHDSYYPALAIIGRGCLDALRVAEAILETSEPWVGRALATDRYDHRTLQWGHDLLAAAWRCRAGRHHPGLPFLDRVDWETETVAAWHGWLRERAGEWPRDSPNMVRQIGLILANQNQPVGYEAEDRLGRAIVADFPEVPWSASVRRLFG